MGRRRRTPEERAAAEEAAERKYRERAAAIDAGIRFAKADSEARALEGGAIAARWEYHDEGYEDRCEHQPRDGEVFVVRGNWLINRGWMRRAGRRYLDEVKDLPAVLPACRCQLHFMFRLEVLPPDMVTAAGLQAIAVSDLSLPRMRVDVPPVTKRPGQRRIRARGPRRARTVLALAAGILFVGTIIYTMI